MTKWVFSLLSLLFQAGLAGQTIEISGEATTCSDCLELIHSLTLGEQDGPGFLEMTDLVAIDGKGQIWVGLLENLKVFSPEGTFIKEIGRRGEGPGEFRGNTRVVADRDVNIHVFDRNNSRHTLFSPDGEILSEWPILGKVPNAVFLEDGRIAANMVSTNRDLVGLPIHLLDPSDGNILQSFGAEEGEHFNLRERWPGYRSLTLGSDTTLWTSSRSKYRFREWDLRTGKKIRELVGQVEWFPPDPAANANRNSLEPLPSIPAIRFNDQGYLVVLILLKAPDWESHMVPKTLSTGMVMEQPDKYENIMDTLIQVINPSSGRLLAAQRFPQVVWGFLGEDLVFGVSEDDLGVPRVEIWNLQSSIR
jgi:hypothetical protein